MYILDICWDNYGFGRFFLSGIHSIAWYVLFYCCCLSVLVVIVSYIFFLLFLLSYRIFCSEMQTRWWRWLSEMAAVRQVYRWGNSRYTFIVIYFPPVCVCRFVVAVSFGGHILMNFLLFNVFLNDSLVKIERFFLLQSNGYYKFVISIEYGKNVTFDATDI